MHRILPTPSLAPTIHLPHLVATLARAAARGVVRPRVRLTTSTGGLVVLTLAGPSARCPGSVNVTSGRAFGSSTWYGRVHADGAWEPARAFAHDPARAPVLEILQAFDTDPSAVGRAQGALTGSCCFCGRELRTRESVGAGYGPVCADRFGLVWGAETAAAYDARKAEALGRLNHPSHLNHLGREDAVP